MKKYRMFVILLLLLLLSACAGRGDPAEMAPPADPENPPALSGTYVINGFDPLGLEYGGHLTITPGDDDRTYQMQWIVVGGIQEGSGVVKGNQLWVEWRSIESSTDQAEGTAVYTITEAGQLDGVRFVNDMDGEGTEQAYPNQ